MSALRNEDAEVAVLAAMLTDGDAVLRAAELVDAGMFTSPRHRVVFTAMLTLAERGTTIDPLTVADHLARRNELDVAGGKDFLAYLLDAVPTSANIAYHAGIVREWAQRRALVRALEQSAASLRAVGPDAPDAQAVARTLADTLLSYTVDDGQAVGFVAVKDLVWGAMEQLEAQASGAITGLRTGYAKIDAETGGFQPGELVIPAGAEKMGKTIVALNLALRFAQRAPAEGGGAVAYVSAEMTQRALVKRSLGILGGIDQRKLRTGALVDGDFQRFAQAGGILSTLPLWIDDEAEPSLADVVARCTALKAQHPEIRCVVVDFLQLVHARERGINESVALTRVAYGLKGLAKRLGVVVIAPCQVNSKDIEDAKDPRPRPKDAQGSSGMRQACDFMPLLYRPAVYDPMENPYEIELNFAVAREAAPFLARLRWDPHTLRIDDHEAARALRAMP